MDEVNFAPVVLRLPIAREFAHRGQLHSLRRIRIRFPLRPICGSDAAEEIDELLLMEVDAERPDRLVTVSSLQRLRAVEGGSRTASRIGFGQAGCAEKETAECAGCG